MPKKTVVCLSARVNELLLEASSQKSVTGSAKFAIDLLLRDYLRKYSVGGDPKVRKAETIKVWRESEARCFATNARLNALSDFSRGGEFLLRVRKYIEGVIGIEPPKGLVQHGGRWSSGATFSDKRGTHFSVKMKTVTTTSEVSYMWDAFAGITKVLSIVPGNKACVVPKTAKIDRMISIEPSGNAFLQQSVGSYFRKRLQRIGINLDDQRPNQDGAFRAIVDDLSTLDLEAASDSVSTSLVRWVLPPEWYSLLNALRSSKTRLDGQWIYLDKFSSMGNGFTFELETLIFWGICKACGCNRELLVYGDDLIVPRENARHVETALAFCGFKLNREKSFFDGPYFESCGKHYYELDEVTPVFQKEAIKDLLSAFRAHNRLTRWAIRTGMWYVVRKALKFIRTSFRSDCEIPFGAERDDGYLTDPRLLRRDKNGDFRCKVLKTKSKTDFRFKERNAYAYKLYYFSHQNETACGHVIRDTGRCQVVGQTTSTVWVSSLIS